MNIYIIILQYSIISEAISNGPHSQSGYMCVFRTVVVLQTYMYLWHPYIPWNIQHV